ncbi:hypothetical protein G9C98_004526, partial [Cotesia typhae]
MSVEAIILFVYCNNTNVNFQVDGQADHDALNRNDGCEGYATDRSEEFQTAEEIEHCNYYNPERFDDYEYENCGHSEYESNIQNEIVEDHS